MIMVVAFVFAQVVLVAVSQAGTPVEVTQTFATTSFAKIANIPTFAKESTVIAFAVVAAASAEEVPMGIVIGADGLAGIMGWLLTVRSSVGKLGA